MSFAIKTLPGPDGGGAPDIGVELIGVRSSQSHQQVSTGGMREFQAECILRLIHGSSQRRQPQFLFGPFRLVHADTDQVAEVQQFGALDLDHVFAG